MACFFNAFFGGSFTKKLPTLLQNGANLAPPLRYSSSCFVVPLCVLFLFHASSLLLLCCSYLCFATPLHASLLLSVLCYSSSCFVKLPCFAILSNSSLLLLLCCSSMLCHSSCLAALPPTSLGCYSSCLVVALCFTSLFFIVLCWCSCFGATFCFIATCVSLLFMLSYYYYFVATWCVVTPLCFIILLPSQVPFCPLLLHCSFMFHYSLA